MARILTGWGCGGNSNRIVSRRSQNFCRTVRKPHATTTASNTNWIAKPAP